MADNLQDFLKRAAAKRQQQAVGEPQSIESVRAEPVIQPVKPAPTPYIEIIETEPVRTQSVTQHVASNVSAHVEQHLNSDEYDRRAERLGDKIETSQLAPHMHEVFDHKVGALDQSSFSDDVYDKDGGDAAYEIADVDQYEKKGSKKTSLIADLLASPKTIRQAFIFSEIIKPPSSRWED